MKRKHADLDPENVRDTNEKRDCCRKEIRNYTSIRVGGVMVDTKKEYDRSSKCVKG